MSEQKIYSKLLPVIILLLLDTILILLLMATFEIMKDVPIIRDITIAFGILGGLNMNFSILWDLIIGVEENEL